MAISAANQRQRDVTSAMYYLVWHGGLSYERALAWLRESPASVRPLAIAGRQESRRCFRGLKRLIATHGA